MRPWLSMIRMQPMHQNLVSAWRDRRRRRCELWVTWRNEMLAHRAEFSIHWSIRNEMLAHRAEFSIHWNIRNEMLAHREEFSVHWNIRNEMLAHREEFSVHWNIDIHAWMNCAVMLNAGSLEMTGRRTSGIQDSRFRQKNHVPRLCSPIADFLRGSETRRRFRRRSIFDSIRIRYRKCPSFNQWH